MKLRWSPIAIRELGDHVAYLARYNAIAAVEVGDTVRAGAKRLADYPYSGRSGRIAGTRELAIPRTSYLLAYRVGPDTVEVLRVLHGAQNWPEAI